MTRRTKTLFACAALLGLGVVGGLSMAGMAPEANAREGYSETMKGGNHGEHRRDYHRGKSENRHAGNHEGRNDGKRHGQHRMSGHGPHHGGFIAELFERYDVEGTGKIKVEDMLTIRADELKKFDKNGDGQLDLQEYEALWLDRMRERMVRSFQHYDRDGNAQVTVEEFNYPINRLAKRLDRNKDGTIEKFDRRGGKDRPDWRRDGDKRKMMDRAPTREAPAGDDSGGDEADTE